MRLSRLSKRALHWLTGRFGGGRSRYTRKRGEVDHFIILDGTNSSLRRGYATNAGLTYRLLVSAGAQSVHYEAGIQWQDWRSTTDVVTGRGINRQIRRAYGYLASHYRPGDRIFLLGYSRGAYAVRSLAGIIDRIGLLTSQNATERNIRQAYRHYRYGPSSASAREFTKLYCNLDAPIEMVGVWDTVKALGLRLPLLWRLSEPRHAFHDHSLGDNIRHGFQALAFHETRSAYAPVLWDSASAFEQRVEQVWFRGTHSDVGGQLSGMAEVRPLANLPLVWMVARLEACNVTLPKGWRRRFARDVHAPSLGGWHGLSKLFLIRRKRRVLRDPSERLHHSLEAFLDARR